MPRTTKTQTPKVPKTAEQKAEEKRKQYLKKEEKMARQFREHNEKNGVNNKMAFSVFVCDIIDANGENIERDDERKEKLFKIKEDVRTDGFFLYNQFHKDWTAKRRETKENTHEELNKEINKKIELFETHKKIQAENKKVLSDLEAELSNVI